MKKSSLIIIGIAILILVAIFALGNKRKDAEPTTAVTGSITYRERMALPVNSVITVTLNDISKADAPAEKIAEQIITPETGAQVPFDFSLAYNPADIVSSHTYAVSAKITVNNNLWWTTDTVFPVITDTSATTSVDMVLVRAGSNNTVDAPVVPTVRLEGTLFTLVQFNDTAVSGTQTVTFKDGNVQAKFCNGMGGTYTQEEFVITAPDMISTMMYCESPEYLMKAESTFGSMLAKGANVTLSEKTLILENGTDRFVFEAK